MLDTKNELHAERVMRDFIDLGVSSLDPTSYLDLIRICEKLCVTRNDLSTNHVSDCLEALQSDQSGRS